MTFGDGWSRALCLGCSRLSALGHPVAPEWVLAIIALESAGTWDPEVLQGRARLVPASGPNDKRAEVFGHNGQRLSHGTGARGLMQHMPARLKRDRGKPDLLTLYAPSDPVVQLTDGIRSWCDQATRHKFGGFRSREALYCANLAPARLIGGEADDETILYSANPEDAPWNERGGRFVKTFWPEAYRANAKPFGLDPMDPRGALRMKHLAHGLDAAVRQCRARYDAELSAVYVVNARGSTR